MGERSPFDVVARDGRRVVVRTAEREDAPGLLELSRALAADGEGAVVEEDEVRSTVGEQERWIDRHHQEPTWLALAAGPAPGEGEPWRVVGVLHVEAETPRRLAHVARLGVGLAPGWRGVGLGRPLMEGLLEWAEANPVLERLELGCLATNRRALGLYRSLGFEEEGRRRRYLKLADGTYVDDVLMARPV